MSDLNRNIYHAAPFWDKSALAKENCHGKIKNGYLGTDAGADGTGRRRILSEWEKTAPREIIRTCCMREKAVYMPDFVMDEEGKLCEVRYDEVTKW